MIKTKTVLEIQIRERIYEFSMSPDSPLGELFDAISQVRGLIIEKINESHQVIKDNLPSEEDTKA
jgi:hypothetical protein